MALQVGSTRGGGLIVNGKVSKTASEAADVLTRSGYRWLDGSDGVVDGVTNISFAFKSSATNTDPASFSRFTEAEINFTLAMMVSWSDVANVKFNRVGTGTVGEAAYANNATILFSNYSAADGSAAYAYMPGNIDIASASGDVHVNINYASSQNYDYLTYGRLTIAHEFGHALGLEHPGTYNGGAPTYAGNAAYAEDSHQYTLMSYFDASYTGASAYMYASSPLMDDIAAAQKLYGANMTTRTGNTVYGFNSTADRDWFAASVNGVARTVVFCVWDAGGTDVFDFSGYSQNQTIDLRAGSFSNVGGLIGNVSIAVGVTIEKAIGGSGADSLIGNDAANSLIGGAGNDLLNGGAGIDTMIGGLGDDTYVVDVAGDVVTELANEGTDTVQTGISYSLGANVENLTLTGSAAVNGVGNSLNNMLIGNAAANRLEGGAGNDTLDGGGGIDTLVGGLGDDTYIVDVVGDVITELANEGADTVKVSFTYSLGENLENLVLTGTAAINGTGNSVNNIMTGNSAANRLDGGLGADTMAGGLGDDSYVVDNVGDIVTELTNEGTDRVEASVSYTLSANVENLTLTGTAAINGTGNGSNNVITGNSAANILNGGAGNDVLDGAGGADTLIGGLGDDSYIIDVAGDIVTELANEGTDTVKASLTYALGANVENLILTGTAAINGTGNALTNVLTGNSAANLLDGGAGLDTLIGGLGDDIYVVDATGDVVTEQANEGTDKVLASVSYSLSANVENLVLTGTAAINGTGNSLNNIITGNSAANSLDGGAGADTMVGGLGDDVYAVDNAGDIVTELANEGTDRVNSSITYSLGANLENLTLTGTAAINGTGNSVNNIMVGNSAANRLDGGLGADTISGGLGDDVYVVDNAGDVVTELANEGNDRVEASISYTLSDNVEALTLTGSAAINGTGNSANNAITGNSAANILNGGAGNDILDGAGGADTLIGGLGDDSYIVDVAGDIVTEQANEGTDTVKASLSYALGANLENLTLTGTAAINGTGNAANNSLIGNSAANRLDGGTGSDTMIGGLGDDTYVVDVAGDIVTELANEGVDTVQSSISYSLGANVENLVLTGATVTGAAAINGTGNSLNNTITGNSAANSLDGGAGADTLIGGLGDDIYFVDNAGDVVTELASQGTDTVNSSVTYSLTANVENLTLTGTAAINGTGNDLNNIILGNVGANVLSGGAGKDFLTGGGGKDSLTGGAGADRFIFTAASDSTSAATDRITDFSWADGDYIDLSAIDANSALAGDQAFSFVTAFSKQAGQATLTYDAATNTTTFSGDVNGDGVADFVLQITGQQDTTHGWML